MPTGKRVDIRMKTNLPRAYYKTFVQDEFKGIKGGTKKVAERIAKIARRFAPVATRQLKNAIEVEEANGGKNYYVTVNTDKIKSWDASDGTGGNPSNRARQVYPISQERSYRKHWIHTKMMPKKVQHKYMRDGIYHRFIQVRRAQPFLAPAFLQAQRAAKEIIKPYFKQIRSRAARKGGLVRVKKIGVFA